MRLFRNTKWTRRKLVVMASGVLLCCILAACGVFSNIIRGSGFLWRAAHGSPAVITLSGNPDEIQKVTLPVTGSPEHHWGGRNDGVLRLPIRGFAFSFHHWLVEKKGVVEFSNIEIHTPDYRVARQVRFTPVSPEKLFRTTSGNQQSRA